MNERSILRADPAYRKKMIRIFLSALLVGFILLSLAIPKLENATLAKDPGKALITKKTNSGAATGYPRTALHLPSAYRNK